MLLQAVLASFSPDDIPRVPEFGTNSKPYVIMFIIGFLVAIAGHLVQAKSLVAFGIGLIFMATFLLPLIAYISAS